ncbi:hypothetical protein [Ligilactobacillus pobuzihii]|nr:hypothetical protein [Ligilactobacillus pobuzihii]
MAFLQKNEARLYAAKIEAKENGVISTKKTLSLPNILTTGIKRIKKIA